MNNNNIIHLNCIILFIIYLSEIKSSFETDDDVDTVDDDLSIFTVVSFSYTTSTKYIKNMFKQNRDETSNCTN